MAYKSYLEVEQPYLGGLLTMVTNHLQVLGWSSKSVAWNCWVPTTLIRNAAGRIVKSVPLKEAGLGGRCGVFCGVFDAVGGGKVGFGGC